MKTYFDICKNSPFDKLWCGEVVWRMPPKPDVAGSKPQDETFFFYLSIFVYFEYEI